MPVDAFLIFTGNNGGAPAIVGETQDKTFKPLKAMEIKSYNFGIENPATIGSASGGGGSGKATFTPFAIEKAIDGCSTKLFQASTMGGHYDTVKLSLRKSGGESGSSKPYLEFMFNMVFISKVAWTGSDDVPSESIEFCYGSLKIQYYKQDQKGAVSTAVSSSGAWSQILNKATDAVA